MLRFILLLLVSVSLLLPASALAQPECNGIEFACQLNDLGSNTYEYVFTLTNNSTTSIAIFKWGITNPQIPSSWQTVGWDLPTGWNGKHPGQHIDFMSTDNGDANPNRLYSPSALSCGPGTNVYVFKWTFVNNGGPTPVCDFVTEDFKIHYQPVNASTCNNVGPSLLCPGPLPVEAKTWGLIKELFRTL